MYITNEYDELGKLTKAIDNCTETVYNYKYNGLGNIEEEKRNGEVFKTLEYDRHNRLAETTINTSDETLVYTPIYETRDSDNAIYADNAIKGMSLEGIFEQSVDKDEYGRPIKASLKVGSNTDELLASEYTYLTVGNRLTNIVDSVTHKVNGYEGEKLAYTYDVKGNITAVVKVSAAETNPEEEYDECGNPICPEPSEPITETIAEYIYDEQNRLTRENNYALGKTYTYSYDRAGNILNKSTYDVTSGAVVTPTDVKLYTYLSTGWKDKLVNYDGAAIAYDMVGNPWYYRGHNLEWDRIRLLTKWDDIIIDYNASGIRTRKGDTYYELDGDSIISETTNGNTIRYYYGNGGIVGFRYNGSRYYYEKNLQGDIIAIYNDSGDKLCEYVYDAWGNCTIKNDISDARIGEVNSFRYRGYYYDSDLGLYYLKSRYYDAVTGRFINADEAMAKVNTSVNGYNLFAYCFNNPINMDDKGGNWPEWTKNTVKFVAKNIVKPVVKNIQNTISNVDATYSRGINLSGTPSAFIFNLQAGISMDTKGNIAIQGSAGGGITGGSPGASITTYQSITNAPSIDKLDGPGYQIGGSIGLPICGVPLAFGGDFNIIPDSTLATTYWGATTSSGFGTSGGEFHIEWGETATLVDTQFNIFDIAEYIYSKIMEW